jgi:sialic acid synthase SpsE
MSTGMCNLEDIDDAVLRLSGWLKPSMITLLHCNSEYPTPTDHVNLAFIPVLRERYKNKVGSFGYSSHDGGVAIPAQAVAYGAEMVEVHVTENRMQDGSDHKASLERTGMEILNTRVEALEEAHGKPEKIVYPGEIKIREKVSQSSCDRMLPHEALMNYLEQSA